MNCNRQPDDVGWKLVDFPAPAAQTLCCHLLRVIILFDIYYFSVAESTNICVFVFFWYISYKRPV